MANKQVRLTDQEHQLILMIRAGAVSMDTITGIIVDGIIRKVNLEQQPIPDPIPQPDPQPEPDQKLIDQLIKHYKR